MKEWVLTDKLTVNDLRGVPVWEYVNDESVAPDTAVRPVRELPVEDLTGRLVGTRVVFSNGSQYWAILNNVSLKSMRSTKHFLGVWIEKDGRWFELARYHDADFERRSPAELARFIGLPVSDVFPIKYDITDVAIGDPAVLKGTVEAEPEERLTRDQIIDLALEN